MNNGKICVSIREKTAQDLINAVEKAAAVADIVEIRFDDFDENQLKLVLTELQNRRESLATPLLATMHEIAGEDFYEKFKIWQTILATGIFQFIDLAHSFAVIVQKYDRNARLPADTKNFIENAKKHTNIYSLHYFEGAPSDLERIYEINIKNSADILKIAVQANDATDGLELMKLLGKAKAENRKFIPIAMGEPGIWTRILGLARGAFMTFAALDGESATAPGQLTAQEMLEVYRVKELDENTEIYGLVGESVLHSASPQMHNTAFKCHELNSVYVPFAVKNLEEFMRRMINPATREIEWNLRGFSVAIPHKVEIMKYLDFIDKTAAEIGSVNTVKVVGDELHGYNTDAEGFIEPLKNSYKNLNGAKVAVLGAGGAARAAIYALKQEGAEVTIFARNLEKALNLAKDFDANLEVLDEEADFSSFQILVNATPLGMKKGELENQAPVKTLQIGGVGLLYDLVYNPMTTKLMREAKAVFVPTLGGLEMLVAQGVAQFKLWTEKDAPIKEMREAAWRKIQT